MPAATVDGVSVFEDPDPSTLISSINLNFVGPPGPLAAGTAALGVLSTIIGIATTGSAGWFGYALGFLGVLVGISYRWLLRRRQMVPMFLPNYLIDRVMLFGVLLSFFGIALNAYRVAQRVIE